MPTDGTAVHKLGVAEPRGTDGEKGVIMKMTRKAKSHRVPPNGFSRVM
jgi:hypothetical protein